MTDLKYINFDTIGIVIFETHVDHAQMARAMGYIPLSAGFVHIDQSGSRCYGKSISLNLESWPKDSVLLNKRIGSHGF